MFSSYSRLRIEAVLIFTACFDEMKQKYRIQLNFLTKSQ